MQQIWQRLAAEGTRVLEHLLRSLPPERLSDLLAFAGWAVFTFGRRRRRIALENLRVAFGDSLDEAGRRRIAAASFASFGRAMADALISDRQLATLAAAEARFEGDDDPAWEQLDADVQSGRGGMILTAHLGSWEVSVPYLRHRGMRLHPVVRTLANPYLDAWATASRAGPDGVIRKGGALRKIMKVIKRGHWVGFLGDQNAGRHGVFVPFFGLDACTFPIPGLLVQRFRWPVYLGVCLRLPSGSYRALLRKVPTPPADLGDGEGIVWALEWIHRQLEAWIRAWPDQYTWLHRRWKTRPIGEGQNPALPDYPHKHLR